MNEPEIKIYLHAPVCDGGGGKAWLGSFIVVVSVSGGGGGPSCESCCPIEKSCVGGGINVDDGIFVASMPCVVGGFGNGNWNGWFPMVNLGWINDDVCWLFAGFNGVNADGGRIEGWIKGDDNWETDVSGWKSGFNVEILFVFCWNNNGEPLEGACVKLFGAGNRGLNGVLAELRNEA